MGICGRMFCKMITSQKNFSQRKNLFGNYGVFFGDTQNSTYPEYNIKTNAGKLKTRKSTCKRFKMTFNGKIIRRQSGKQHPNEKKAKTGRTAYPVTAALQDVTWEIYRDVWLNT